MRHRYVIQVDNWTRKPQTVRVVENVPVSQVADVKVTLDPKGTRPDEHNEEDGIVAWSVKVPPRSKRRITVAYTVSLPKSYRVSGYR